VTRTLLDTSFFIAVERRDLQALASPTLSSQRRAFYEKLRFRFDVLPVTEHAAMAGIAAARRVGGAKAPDVMIAGVARLLGDEAEVLRAS
jgi:predicted nucleic acid-binding protein